MKLNKHIIALIFILVIAAFLRLYSLGSVPPSASLDEASIGWNAYSILQTGKDEYGKTFPILLRAYDDYRPALYVYTVIPFVKFLGLNALAVRLPAAILSILTVLAIYFLIKEAFSKQNIVNNKYLALVCTFLLAISPWHIYMSRLGHEVNLAFSAFIFALVFFLKRNVYLSAIFLIISFASYQSEKIFIPIILFTVFIIYRKEFSKLKKKIFIASLFSLIILAPFMKETFSQSGLIRFSATNVFKANKSLYIDQSLLLEKAVQDKDLIGQLIYNRRLLSSQIFTAGYLSHFDPVWLFTNLTQDKHKIPNIGLLYLWTLPFILIGLYNFTRHGFDKKIKKLIFVWFLTAPIPASIATQSPHALRSLIFLPVWLIFSALGILYAYTYFKTKGTRFKKSFIVISIIILFFSLSHLYKQYFYVFPKTQSDSFQYALSGAIPYAVNIGKDNKKIIFDNNANLSQSYMLFLFYTKYDPKLYLSQGGTVSGGYEAIHRIGKYEFRPIDMEREESGNLYVVNYPPRLIFKDTIVQVKVLKDVYNLNKEKTIEVLTK